MLRWWPMVTKRTLRADLMAGLSGTVILLPQAVAYATIAGLPPEFGLDRKSTRLNSSHSS